MAGDACGFNDFDEEEDTLSQAKSSNVHLHFAWHGSDAVFQRDQDDVQRG